MALHELTQRRTIGSTETEPEHCRDWLDGSHRETCPRRRRAPRALEDLRRAVRGQDAVISIVVSEGRGPTTVMSDVTRAELDAMREAGVRRLVSVSVSAIEGRRPWILINLVRWILRKPYADFARMERLITSSPIDWTIVRPPYLSNGRKTGRVRTQVGGKDLPRGPYHISRADLAATLVDLAEDSQHVREVLLVSEQKAAR